MEILAPPALGVLERDERTSTFSPLPSQTWSKRRQNSRLSAMDRPWSDRLRIGNLPKLGLYDLQFEPPLVSVEPARSTFGNISFGRTC
jgi:hypothetical protein